MWEYLRTKIHEVITAQVTEVDNLYIYRTERSKYDGYPAIVIAPSDSESDYNDTSQQADTFVFNVRVYKDVVDGGIDEADLRVEKVVDQLLEVFRNRSALGNAPDRVDWVIPAPSRWGWEGNTEIGVKRFAEVKLRCRSHRA